MDSSLRWNDGKAVTARIRTRHPSSQRKLGPILLLLFLSRMKPQAACSSARSTMVSAIWRQLGSWSSTPKDFR